MNSDTLDRLKKILYAEILRFHLPLFFLTITIAIFSICLEISLCFTCPLLIIIIGHFIISNFVVFSHVKAGTKDFLKEKSEKDEKSEESKEDKKDDLDKFGIFLIQTAGLFEIFFYTFLLIFHQVIFIIGYLVVKSIWNYPIESGHDKNNRSKFINKQTKANSIFRIGVILSFIVSLVAAFFIITSSEYDDLKENKHFQTVDEIFVTKTD